MGEENSIISLKEVIKEFRKHYKKDPKEYDFKYPDKFFEDENETMEYYLEIIIADYQKNLNSIKFEWSIIGSFFELFTKICLLKKDWNNLKTIFNMEKREYYCFNKCKDLIIKDLKLKLDKKKIERIKDIFEIILLQRNNSVHNPISMNEHYGIQRQVFELILFLNKYYKIDFSEWILKKINEKIKISKEGVRLDFEEINLLEELD